MVGLGGLIGGIAKLATGGLIGGSSERPQASGSSENKPNENVRLAVRPDGSISASGKNGKEVGRAVNEVRNNNVTSGNNIPTSSNVGSQASTDSTNFSINLPGGGNLKLNMSGGSGTPTIEYGKSGSPFSK